MAALRGKKPDDEKKKAHEAEHAKMVAAIKAYAWAGGKPCVNRQLRIRRVHASVWRAPACLLCPCRALVRRAPFYTRVLLLRHSGL